MKDKKDKTMQIIFTAACAHIYQGAILVEGTV